MLLPPSEARLVACVWCLCWLSVAPSMWPLLPEAIRTHPDLPKLPVPKTLDELQRLARDLPHVLSFNGQVCEAGHPLVAGTTKRQQSPGGPVCTQHSEATGGQKDTYRVSRGGGGGLKPTHWGQGSSSHQPDVSTPHNYTNRSCRQASGGCVCPHDASMTL
ncbi:hypothetical protein KUCAC02_020050 [Chaenocephalus aceratus]|uniref:Uncharacterized protein n=1 Tax=Chaenocephalus aceratus TaxID=36190 RepID=A0ACB9VRL2_CHAAC|nr:hypothetical protein KUCAC02_020050 [Chaenocephalus aceratus]